MELLKVENLCKTYGKGEAKVDALKNVLFCLEKGEFTAVVGESGSGKSTLLNCVGALDVPTSGSVFIAGQNHYLKLVPISAKIHHKQSKMTRICITLISVLSISNLILPLSAVFRWALPYMATGLVLSNYAHNEEVVYLPLLSLGILIVILI